MTGRLRWLVAFVAACMIAGVAQADRKELLTLKVADAISPAIAEFVADSLKRASDTNAAGIIIELDTPGGLVDSTREIVQAIYACQVPVIVYVTPSGARAASAGVMITMAADIAAMTPGTNIGAAHPVGAGGQDIGHMLSLEADPGRSRDRPWCLGEAGHHGTKAKT